jgi:TrmH family RNA methyltransferase
MLITSPQNPRVKQVAALRDRRERESTGLTQVEGYDELALVLSTGARPVSLFVCPDLFRSREQAVLIDRARDAGAEVIEVSERVFDKLAYREGPDGWLATFPSPARPLEKIRLGGNPFVVVAEAVEKPGNLGAILRTADAAGVEALIAAAPITDWGNPNIVRSSKGALFSVPVAEADNEQTLAWLGKHGITIVTASPQAMIDYTQADFRGPVALVVGSEKYGLSYRWFAAAKVNVRIPMFGRVNSLNVATSTALLVYEVVRQRSL